AGSRQCLSVAALREVSLRIRHTVCAGPQCVEALHRLTSFFGAPGPRQREAEAVRRGHVVRLSIQSGLKEGNRVRETALLRSDLSELDFGARVGRVQLEDTLER